MRLLHISGGNRVCLADHCDKVLNTTSCATNNSLACLRALPYPIFHSALLNSSYGGTPIPDGDFMQQSNVMAISQGKIVSKPLLVGAVRDEATCEFRPGGLRRARRWRLMGYFLTQPASEHRRVS